MLQAYACRAGLAARRAAARECAHAARMSKARARPPGCRQSSMAHRPPWSWRPSLLQQCQWPRSGPARIGLPAGRGFWVRNASRSYSTKEHLLANAAGPWERLRIRTKYFLIKSYRPFNWDEIWAFVSWLFLGHLVWVLVGTTTFFSLAIVGLNTVFAQEQLAEALGAYVTRNTGLTVLFESAIVPKWKDGRISFKNVYVSRRPKRESDGKHTAGFRKGSLSDAAVAAAAVATTTASTPASSPSASPAPQTVDDGNYTQFDLTIASVDVTFSLARLFNGRGIVKDIDVKGVRGVVDRTHVHWDPDVSPKAYKHEHHWGDFELEEVRLEDLLVTVYQPEHFRPFDVSVFSCELPRLRKQWLFYDILSASHMSGSYDNSLFTLHPKQTYESALGEHETAMGGMAQHHGAWRESRLRVDSVNIDHLNRGVDGAFGWIYKGTADLSFDIRFPPAVLGEDLISEIMSNSNRSTAARDESAADNVRIDIGIQLNDVKASVPIFTNDISYVNNALIRPIVAYINSRRTHVPLACRVEMPMAEFDGSWTLYDSGLMDEISREVYDTFARNVEDQQNRRKRLQKVGFWSIQLASQLLLVSFRSFYPA